MNDFGLWPLLNSVEWEDWNGQVRDGFEGEVLRGQATLWQCIFGFVDGMALKRVLPLGIHNIINSHGRPLSLSSIAKATNHSSLDTDRLSRVMTLLIRREIFSSIEVGVETLYGLTNSSKWLLGNSEMSLAPFFLLEHHPYLFESWHHLADIVKEGGSGLAKSHNVQDNWKFPAANPDFSNLFNQAIAGASKIIVEAVKTSYEEEFNGIETLVYVGGGIETMVSEIMKAHPISKVSTLIFHLWSLRHPSTEAISDQKKGKVIIIEAVLSPEGSDLFDDTGVRFDPLMMVQINAKERSEAEWKFSLEKAGLGVSQNGKFCWRKQASQHQDYQNSSPSFNY
ncbi:hypothetical protein GH714_017369 [Hevea brasiliensis]|uniref:O-methyltransferase domain-containing protein n=1 Tax=Hevea brasiliensis TaxID=3981 RepID=A0A6A6N8N6_HEVBR|nr:hypothetical protein GH714_017369 [Hevea brasiliensis]